MYNIIVCILFFRYGQLNSIFVVRIFEANNNLTNSLLTLAHDNKHKESQKREGTIKYYGCAGSRARIAIFTSDWRNRRKRCVGGSRGKKRNARPLKRYDEIPRKPIRKSSSPGTSARWCWHGWKRNVDEGWTKQRRNLIAPWYKIFSMFF